MLRFQWIIETIFSFINLMNRQVHFTSGVSVTAQRGFVFKKSTPKDILMPNNIIWHTQHTIGAVVSIRQQVLTRGTGTGEADHTGQTQVTTASICLTTSVWSWNKGVIQCINMYQYLMVKFVGIWTSSTYLSYKLIQFSIRVNYLKLKQIIHLKWFPFYKTDGLTNWVIFDSDNCMRKMEKTSVHVLLM